MFKTMFAAACAVAVCLPSNSARASDGNTLLDQCSAVVTTMDTNRVEGDTLGRGFCLGLVQGIANSVQVF